MIVDLRSRSVRLLLAVVVVSIAIALFWEVLPPYGLRLPFNLPEPIVLLADIVAVFTLAGAAVGIVATLTGWIVELDRASTRRWQGVTLMSFGFYLARYGGWSLAPNLDEARREAVLAGLQRILDRGDTAIFAMTDNDGFVDRILLTTPASAATVREWASRLSADSVVRTSRVDRAELAQRYPGMFGPAWWIAWA